MSYSIESFGKLLISGEYLILKGAKGLSIPVNFSQTLNVDENTSGYFDWKSYDIDKISGSVVNSKFLIFTTNKIIITTYYYMKSSKI